MITLIVVHLNLFSSHVCFNSSGFYFRFISRIFMT
uniref:Uncharacterized protein n=1 Tax=Ascaris lumbricoides TaxID=6252 RepID=A0A0M3HM94_ASCLU